MRWIFIFIVFFGFAAQSQSVKDYEKKWELAKAHYADKNYDLAVILFQNLTPENVLNPYVEYANYYTALCNFHLGKMKIAREYLLQLNGKYPLWEKKEDANYLLANIEFELEKYEKATRLLQGSKIKDAENLKLAYLQRASLPQVKMLLDSFPHDKQVATVYCYKMAISDIVFDKDRHQVDSIIRKHKIKSDSLNKFISNSMGKLKKDTFHVALIYPFILNELKKYPPNRKNQFLIDHYWGMQLAEDSIKPDSSTSIIYHLYDNANDSNRIKQILAYGELKKMDAVVGSIYRKNMHYISRFCDENQIICFNPMSNYANTIQDSGFVYMYNPAYESIGISAAQFVIDSFATKKIMVLCFKDDKDTLIANTFIQKLAENNIKIAKKLFVDKNTDVLSVLSRVRNEEVELIFAPSQNTSIATNITSWTVIREIDIPVIGNATWMESREYNIVNTNNRNAYFYDENYIDELADSTHHFYDMYFSRYNVPPTTSSYKGFELGHFLEYHFATYGKYFNQSLWNMEPYEGVFYPAFDYKSSYYNNFVPIHKLQDFQRIPANYVRKVEEATEVKVEKPKKK